MLSGKPINQLLLPLCYKEINLENYLQKNPKVLEEYQTYIFDGEEQQTESEFIDQAEYSNLIGQDMQLLFQ